jgi:glutamate synthase domain-containing protein 3
LPFYPEDVTTSGYNLLDDVLIERAAPALESGTPVTIDGLVINNRNRSVGAMLSNVLSKRYGGAGLPDDTITVNLEGHTGQSFAFTLAKGITVNVQGDANDGCGKGLSGGMICVTPGPEVIEGGLVPEEHVVLGNCALYGATSGRAFFRGKAGERFCVRNSGAITVVEGIGDHGCEYMTGGRVVCLGPTGINFGAGMSGGVAYIWDPDESFAINCNMGMVEMERVESDAEADTLRSYLQEHTDKTGSTVAAELLSSWPAPLGQFVKVMPTDYKRVLEQQAAEADADAAIG